MAKKLIRILTALTLLVALPTSAARLAIVIDDFGYRPVPENQVLALPSAIAIAVLPDAPHAQEMARKAAHKGHEVLIHMPMAPLSKQSLEKNTLSPAMSQQDIDRLIAQAVAKVPFAIGMNNHMGSAMTSSLPAMQKVMHALKRYPLRYFLDSVTIGHSQASLAAQQNGIPLLKRNVFLDDDPAEAAVRQQFQRAVRLAQRQGFAIAIGHPHPVTVRVLQRLLPELPADVQLTPPSQLLHPARQTNVRPETVRPTPPAANRHTAQKPPETPAGKPDAQPGVSPPAQLIQRILQAASAPTTSVQ